MMWDVGGDCGNESIGGVSCNGHIGEELEILSE